MEEKNSENNQKIPTNLVSKEERYLRMFFTYIRLDANKKESKHSVEKILTKDKSEYNDNIEKLKKDWITVYYNIYDYFICKQDYIYTYFFNALIYLCDDEAEKNTELKTIIISLMRICLSIYPPPREDIINFYQLFRLKDLNQKKFSTIMEIFDIIYSYNKLSSTFKEYFSSYDEKEFFLLDGNSHIEIKLDKEWISSGFKENPKNDRSKAYYVLGFTFRYFKKYENSKLVQIRFPSNKYLVFSLKNNLLNCNLKFKDDIQIPIDENKDYIVSMAFLKNRIQIYINDKEYETSETIEEVAKNLIVGDKFFGIFYKIYSTFTFDPLEFTKGSVTFSHPSDGGKFHFFNASSYNTYQTVNFPKKIIFKKKNSFANVIFDNRCLIFNIDKCYVKNLKNYGNFATFIVLLIFFIYKPEFYKKEYIKLIFDKIKDNCAIYENEKLFANNIYIVQLIIILINFPKENRDLEIIDYISPLVKYNSYFNYYLDILKLVYGYEPEKNRQPFSYHLIDVMIKKILKVNTLNDLKEVKDILINTLELYNIGNLDIKKENIAEDIYSLLLLYFKNFKSPNKDFFFYVPYYFWFITLYIFYFELKNKIKEIEIIYNRLKEMDTNEFNDENNQIIKVINYYILLLNNDNINFIFSKNDEDKSKINYLYISYIFKLYEKLKSNKKFENLINNNLKDSKNKLLKYKFENIDDYKDKNILYFLIPCVYNLPYIKENLENNTNDDANSLILNLLCEDMFLNETKQKVLFELIKLLKNICINLKYNIKDNNIYLIYFIKNEIYKQIKKYDFEVDNSFYKIFEKDEEYAKQLSIDISNLFNNLYSKLNEDKGKNITNHEISKDNLKGYLNPNKELYQEDGLISNSSLENIIINFIYRKNWIKSGFDEQFFYNQNWTDFDFAYNQENKNPKYSLKVRGTNDLKFPFLYKIPNITKLIKHRNRKDEPESKLTDIFKENPEEPFPMSIHLTTREIKTNLDFILKYHEDLNLYFEKEYLTDNKKKYPCSVVGSTNGRGFLYVKDENTIEYQNYYNYDKNNDCNFFKNLNGISTDKNLYFDPVRLYNITFKKEEIKMFFKRINYYEDQALEIYLYLGSVWYFVFKENRDQFLEEAGLIIKEEKKENKKSSEIKDDSILDVDWRSKYMFRVIYNDLNYKSGLFIKSKVKTPIGYISKYFRFPDENKYWENTCLSDILRKWKEHELSTFTLLMYLNIFSGRSIEEKTQNIIMPLLILLNNDNKAILRNLKLPLGQQKLEGNQDNLKRISYYDSLFKKEKDKKKAYFYPCSISTQKSSFKSLSTLIPYSQISKSVFNDNNNILISLNKDITDSLTNINNINESTPELFYIPEILTNINNLKDIKLDEVELPSLNIINNTNYNFDKNVLYTLTLNKILESKEVNDTIGNWIDLVFGIDQHSEKLKNIYKPECYLNDKSQLEKFKNNQNIIDNLPIIGTMPLQLIKSNKFNSLVTRKYMPLDLSFPIKETITVKLNDFNSDEMINFSALDSENYVFYGEGKIWNINSKNIKNNQSFQKYTIKNTSGVFKELFNPKVFKKIYALSRLYKYSVHSGNIDNSLVFYNHRKFDRAYNDYTDIKNMATAVEIMDFAGYEHYLLLGKQNGHVHHYKIDFGIIDDFINYPDDGNYPAFFYGTIFRYHNKEVVSIKYNSYLNLFITSSKDGFVHILNINGYIVLSTFIKNKNIKFSILASDPIPCFVVYFDDELNCFLLNQTKPLRKLKIKSELYNFDIIKSNTFEDFLICQDENKIYIISLPYLEIVHEINERFTSFDYLIKEKLIIGFLRQDDNQISIKKIKCDI